MPKQNGFEKSYLCTCVRVNSICSKLERIFKHICLMTWTHAYVCMEWHGILIQKIEKWSETHETLVDVISCHQHDVVKKLACLTNVWTHTPHKPEQLTRRLVVPRGKMHVWWRTGDSFLLRPSIFFLHITCTTTTVMWNFGKF